MYAYVNGYIYLPQKIWGIGNDADNYIGSNILSAILS
jgi:hypothetical protein